MKPLSYQHYLLYIKSAEWQRTKERYWEKFKYNEKIKDTNWKPTCKGCGTAHESKYDFHIHHKSYKNFGNENVNELVHLCESCHEKIHVIARSHGINMFVNGNKKATLWGITAHLLNQQRKKESKKARRARKVAKRAAKLKNKVNHFS